MKRSILVVLPCYNVEKQCELIIKQCLQFCSQLVLVNDGSVDKTLNVLTKISASHRNVHVINSNINQGKGFALIQGFQYALEHFQFDALVTLDSDGQHDPNFINTVAEPIFHGADMVIGGRSFNEMPRKSRFGNRFISFLLKLLYSRSPVDTQSGMRAFNRAFLESLLKVLKGGYFEVELYCLLFALKEGKRIEEVSIPTIYFDKNKSTNFLPFWDSFRILKALIHHLLGIK